MVEGKHSEPFISLLRLCNQLIHCLREVELAGALLKVGGMLKQDLGTTSPFILPLRHMPKCKGWPPASQNHTLVQHVS